MSVKSFEYWLNYVINENNSINEATKFDYSFNQKFKNLKRELNEIENQIKQLYSDMESDSEIEISGGVVADKYGKEIEDLEIARDKIKSSLTKMANPVSKARLSETYKILRDNLDDIKKSIKNFPERTLEENAKIFKERYKMYSSTIENIIIELNKLLKLN